MLEYNILKQLLSEQQKTNALLEQLLSKTAVNPKTIKAKEGGKRDHQPQRKKYNQIKPDPGHIEG